MHPGRLPIALLLGIFLFSAFCLTGSKRLYGYEGRHAGEVEAWLRGEQVDAYIAGLTELAGYVPFAAVKVALEPTGRLQSIQNILYVPVQPLWSTLLCLAFYALAWELYRRRTIAVALTLVLAFGTMVWPYAKFGMETPQSALTVASAWLLLRYLRRPGWGSAAAFAVGMSALALTKVTALLHCLVLAIAACWLLWRAGRWRDGETLRHGALAAAIGLAAFAVLLVSNRVRFGGWLYAGRYNIETELTTGYLVENLFGTFLGPGKSIFLFNPPLLLALVFLPLFWRRFAELRPVLLGLGIVTVWYLLLSAHFHDETWGPRRLHFLVPFLMLPLGVGLERWRTYRHRPWALAAAAAVLLAGVAVQKAAIQYDYTHHARALARHPVYSIQNNVWRPEMNAIAFNVHLLRSGANRLRGGESIPYTIAENYVPWDAPEELPEPLVFDVSEYDLDWDFWWWQERRDWRAAGARWFPMQASSLVALLNVLLVAGSGAVLGWRLARRRHRHGPGASA